MGELRQAGTGARVQPRRRVAIALGNALVFSVSGGPNAAAGAREELRERFGPKLDPETIEIAQLLLSELVNNCVLHGAAATPEDGIDIMASLYPHSLWVEVSDGGPAFKHEPPPPSPDPSHSRGLYLVQQIASRWGISDHGRARVWFELQRGH